MPPILNAQSISKQFGAQPLFRDLSFTVEEGARIGLIGPNGSGKSTLLAVLAGQLEPDAGEMAVRKRARVAYVPQESRFMPGMTVREVLDAALKASHVVDTEREGRLRELAGRAGLQDLAADAAALSGGWRKRLAIVAAIVGDPDVLLLDEPTNHLDLEGIEWLESLLGAARFAAVTVSHDRYFLEATSTEILELNRVYAAGMLRVKGNFSRFLEERQAYLEAQTRQQESLRNQVRTEIEWLRRGPKARTTKSKARIDTAQAMIGQLAAMDARSVVSTAGIDFAASERKTRRLVEFENVACSMGNRKLFSGLNFVLTAGSKVGLVGPNGSGKTTLLRLLRGEIEPEGGAIRRANALRLVYLSQMRELDEEMTLRRALAPEGDAVIHLGRTVHVASWAARFQFTGEQLNQPVKNLSGGERARVLIARLMLEPADVLLLDEPTNDLDIPTLEILEENLLEFPGALLLVTHDRFLLNRVATTVLGLDGRGRIGQFADFAQWEEWAAENAEEPASGQQSALSQEAPDESRNKIRKKLSYLEAREFAAIEDRVVASDARLTAARAQLESPEIATDASALQQALEELKAAQHENDALYARWAELTEKAG
ncbi:MAG: ABC-F family ATP-binding cassette domain-containing protein [Terracidiphilus sp.]